MLTRERSLLLRKSTAAIQWNVSDQPQTSERGAAASEERGARESARSERTREVRDTQVVREGGE